MPDTQEKLLSVEEAQVKLREESVYTGNADSDKTPAEEAEEKRLEEEAEIEAQKLADEEAEKEANEKAELEAEEKAEKEAEEEQNRKEEEERLEAERLENERIESEKFQYKSQEEAEKGAKEAKRKMHEATAEAKNLKEEIEAIRKETSQAAKAGEIDEEQEKTLKNVFVDMLSKIDELDVSDDTYREQLADIWARGLGEGYSIREQERDTALKAKQAEEDSNKNLMNQANTLAKKAGLDMDFIDDDGKQISTVDYDLFWATVAKSEPVGETPEEKIDWVINEVKGKRLKDKERIVNQQKLLSEKSKAAQNKNKVLEKGLTVPQKKNLQDVVPLSITEGLSRIERRI